MVRGIPELFAALEQLLPMEWVIGIAVVLAAIAIPLWMESVRAKQIRGLVRRMVRAEAPERERLAGEALRLAGRWPRRLQLVGEMAVKYDQRALRERAVGLLQQHGGDPRDVKRLRDADKKPPARVLDPISAAVRVEQLLADGLVVAAREHLEAARRAFPADEELAALEGRLSAAADPADPGAARP